MNFPLFLALQDILDEYAPLHFQKTMLRACLINEIIFASFRVCFLLGLSCFVHDTKLFFEIENEREGRKLNIYFNQESQQGIPWLTTIILEMHLQFEICDVTYLNWSLTVLLFNGSELTFLVEQNQTFAALSLIYVSE